MTALVFALMVLAAYRATRFVTDDSLIDRLRHRWFLRFPPDEEYGRWRYEEGRWVAHQTPVRPPHKLGQLIQCPLCVGWWASAVVLVAFAAFGFVDWRWRSIAFWPAVAGGQGLLNLIDSKLSD